MLYATVAWDKRLDTPQAAVCSKVKEIVLDLSEIWTSRATGTFCKSVET